MYAVPAFAQPQRIRMGMVGFESRADGVSQQQAAAIADLFTRALVGSRSLSILEREQIGAIINELELGVSGLVDINTAIQVGRLHGLQYMILGSVTELSERASGGVGAVPFLPIPVAIGGGRHEARATVDIRVVNVTTSEVVLATMETGTARNAATAVYIAGFAMAEAEFGGLQSRAIADAVQRLAHVLRSEIGGEYSHVLSVAGDQVTIDVGANLGSQAGHLYLVFADGRSIVGMHGEIISRERIPLAVIQVMDVGSGHSVGRVVPAGGDITLLRRGDKIEPISSANARSLADGNRFVTSRPAASSGTFEQLFGAGGSGAAVAAQPAHVEHTMPAEQPAPAYAAAPTVAPLPVAPTPAPAAANRTFENESTDPAVVIATYNLTPGERNLRRIAHLNAQNSRTNQEAYDAFAALVASYSGDYLAAFRAGERAQRMRDNDNARTWFNRALSINPNYRPAINALERL